MPFPTRLSEITLDWLNKVFEERGLLGGRKIIAFEAVAASGRGGTSSVRVLTLTYDQPVYTAPKKVLVKFSSESEAVRKSALDHRLYQREIAFYAHYGMNPGIPTPACYAWDYDERSNTCVLLLEHIENIRSRDVHEGGPEDIDQAVRYLAPFHARWWGKESALEFIESEYARPALNMRIEKAALALNRIKEGGHSESLGKTSLAILELWQEHARHLAAYSLTRPQTMCHGSFHRGQILFPEQAGGTPHIIDWQNVSINIGANDLARIVVSGLLPDQRRQRERGLIELYHSLLLKHGVRDYPMEDLLDDYRLGIVNLIVFHSLMFAYYPVEVVARFWKEEAPFWQVLFHWPGEAAEEMNALKWLKETINYQL